MVKNSEYCSYIEVGRFFYKEGKSLGDLIDNRNEVREIFDILKGKRFYDYFWRDFYVVSELVFDEKGNVLINARFDDGCTSLEKLENLLNNYYVDES